MTGFRDWLLTEEQKQIPNHAIKIALPVVRQQTNYSCGAQALRTIAKYFQVGPDSEKDFIKLCHTSTEKGTTPANLAKAGLKIGLHTALKQGMTLKELISYIKQGIPVVCNMQAWGEKEDYPKDESGHYIVAIGFDDSKIYFEDPSIDNPDRGYLSYEEFEKRWHDQDRQGKRLNHLGIAFWKKNPEPDAKRSRAKKIR